MAAEDQHAALRADVLLAVAAAGTTWRAEPGGRPRGVDLGVTAPPLVPTSDFGNRHARDRGLLDREITAGRFKDLPSHVPGALPCWCWPVDRAADRARATTARGVDAAGPGLLVPRRRSLPDHPRPLPRLDVTAAGKAAMTAVLTRC
jgi:hypothetical protein